MKKVLVTMAVLALVASMSQASILSVWITTDTVTQANVNFNVYIYAKVLPSYQGEVLTDHGIGDISVTIFSADTTNKITPVNGTGPTASKVVTTFNTANFDNGTNIPGAFSDATTAQQGGIAADGDKDAVGMSTATSGGDLNVGVGGTGVWVATETWKFTTLTRAYLGVSVGSSSRYWDVALPSPWKAAFTSTQVAGAYVGPVSATPPVLGAITGPTRVATGYTGTWTLPQTGGDAATAATLAWGDSNTSNLTVPLPASANHAYAAAGSYTIAGNASNAGGNATPVTMGVTVVDNPSAITVTVDGNPVANGQVLTIYGHNFPLIVASGQGTIDGWTFKNGSTTLAGTNTWTDDSYKLYGGTLTFTAFNTATGSTPATFSFTVVPEPATLALLGFGAVATLLRRRK